MQVEDGRIRFRRLAGKRTNAVLENIRILSNCANQGRYDYTKEEVDKIFSAISSSLQNTKAKFETSRTKSFSL
ncbi:hypothetical protein HYR82_01260 [Candidatus Peregrinibacteria bacterium]|nr:hypothetical protein [Candidatus Peregrinibacteria bacterium]